ncbi:MAG: ATP-binding protein [Candidatus Dormibacteraceae bacterium]
MSLVLSGSRRHVMHDLHSGPGAPLLGVGELMTLDTVPESDMIAFIKSRSEVGGKRMIEGAARLLFNRARGVPAYVQRLAFEAFEVAERKNIDEKTAEMAVDTVLKRERQYFEVMYEDLAPNQRNLIRALASQPEKNPTSRDFLDRARLRADSSSHRALSALESAEKVELGPNGWQVSDPLFALWLAREAGGAA